MDTPVPLLVWSLFSVVLLALDITQHRPRYATAEKEAVHE